jgi:hypothetical protein
MTAAITARRVLLLCRSLFAQSVEWTHAEFNRNSAGLFGPVPAVGDCLDDGPEVFKVLWFDRDVAPKHGDAVLWHVLNADPQQYATLRGGLRIPVGRAGVVKWLIDDAGAQWLANRYWAVRRDPETSAAVATLVRTRTFPDLPPWDPEFSEQLRREQHEERASTAVNDPDFIHFREDRPSPALALDALRSRRKVVGLPRTFRMVANR